MHFIYDTVITWEKTYMDECINILQKLCDDHIQEKSDFQTLVNQNLFQIEKINSYLKSLFEKEDPEFKVFSPRNVENVYEKQIASNQSEKEKLEEKNLDYYKKINRLNEQIEQLSYVIDTLKSNTLNSNTFSSNTDMDSNLENISDAPEENITIDNTKRILNCHISHRIMNCISYIDCDPKRAKEELKAIVKKFS